MSHSYFTTRFKYEGKKDLIWNVLCKYLQKYIPQNSRVLDVGAGYCFFINNIIANQKYAMDANKDVLMFANKDVTTIVGTTQCMCFDNNFFDIVFVSNVLEHLSIDDILQALIEFKRILKNNGTLIILSPNFRYSYKEYFDDYTHKSILTDESITDILLSVGFGIDKIMPKFIPFSVKSRLPFNKILMWIYLRFPWKPFAGQMLVIAKR